LLTREYEIDSEHARNIFGSFDSYVKEIEKRFRVTIVNRDGKLKIMGEVPAIEASEKVLDQLTALSRRGNTITQQQVNYILDEVEEAEDVNMLQIDEDLICHTMNGKPVKPKTAGQKKYVDSIRDHMIVFGLGPAGTGKTYLAVALAVRSLKNREARKIILSRPAVEAGEKLGFLPGDMKDKIDPYLQPLYDALEDMIPIAKLKEYMENNIIQIAPLAFMRGRTLNDAIIVLDEAQNTTTHQIKMFLTRLGMGSKMIVTGDTTQIDLPRSTSSGLIHALRVLDGVKGIGKVEFEKKDIVRHHLVQRIVEAYERYHEEEKLFAQNAKDDNKA
jgi:phosphate starvation-inducible PhoH-like protein